MRIGIDLGGTKIAAVLMDAEGNIRHSIRQPSPQGSYSATLQTLEEIVFNLDEIAGQVCPVGIGTPGSITPAEQQNAGLLRNSNSTWLNGKPLLDDLRLRLRREVKQANDANCFALSEATDGAAAGALSVFGVILGTGVGGGLVVNGQLLIGHNAVGGEWGHNPLPWPIDEERSGGDCYCGLQGCLETWLSGPALEREFLKAGGEAVKAVEIDRLARTGDPIATETLEGYCNRLARGLASVINLFDPECIVLGGGLSQIDRLYERVPELWQSWVFAEEVRTRLLPPRHGDASGVRGAAWLN